MTERSADEIAAEIAQIAFPEDTPWQKQLAWRIAAAILTDRAARDAEIVKLQAWKASALQVLNRITCSCGEKGQECPLGCELGAERCSANELVAALSAKNDTAYQKGKADGAEETAQKVAEWCDNEVHQYAVAAVECAQHHRLGQAAEHDISMKTMSEAADFARSLLPPRDPAQSEEN